MQWRAINLREWCIWLIELFEYLRFVYYYYYYYYHHHHHHPFIIIVFGLSHKYYVTAARLYHLPFLGWDSLRVPVRRLTPAQFMLSVCLRLAEDVYISKSGVVRKLCKEPPLLSIAFSPTGVQSRSVSPHGSWSMETGFRVRNVLLALHNA
jgi:hypothetical protein